MFDCESFITNIKARECLWNSSSDLFDDRDERATAWEQIAAELYGDWPRLSEEVQTNIVKELQKKWKNIKDCFVKEHKRLKAMACGYSVTKKKKYIYYDILKFLIPMLRKHKVEYTLLAESKPRKRLKRERPPEPTVKVEIECDGQAEYPALSPEQPINFYTRNQHAPERPPSSFEDRILTMWKAQQEEIQEQERDDDRSFFNSLMPSVKRLSTQQKFDFRLGVLELLKRVSAADGGENSFGYP